MRAVTAALVGALCGVAWAMSLLPIGFSLCQSSTGIGCAAFTLVIAAPALAVGWGLVAWALLRLARFAPAWPTAVLGPVGAFVLALAALSVAPVLGLEPSAIGILLVVALAAAASYASAAVLTAGRLGRSRGGAAEDPAE